MAAREIAQHGVLSQAGQMVVSPNSSSMETQNKGFSGASGDECSKTVMPASPYSTSTSAFKHTDAVLSKAASSPLLKPQPRQSPLSRASNPKVSSKFLLGPSKSQRREESKESLQNHSRLRSSTSKAMMFRRCPGFSRSYMYLKDIETQQVSKEAAAAFHDIDLHAPRKRVASKEVVQAVGQEDDKPPSPPPIPAGARQLANELKIPLCDVKEAVSLFRSFATFPNEEQNLDEGTLRADKIKDVLCTISNVSSLEELNPEFVEATTKLADRDRSGHIDVKEFTMWYYALSFSEEVTLGPEAKETRKLAKQFGIDNKEMDRYKECFDKFANAEGVIDFASFSDLINEVLKVPSGHQLFPNRLLSMWRTADTDGGGSIEFDEFCIFYLKSFQSSQGDAIMDYYRNVRRVPVAARR